MGLRSEMEGRGEEGVGRGGEKGWEEREVVGVLGKKGGEGRKGEGNGLGKKERGFCFFGGGGIDFFIKLKFF